MILDFVSFGCIFRNFIFISQVGSRDIFYKRRRRRHQADLVQLQPLNEIVTIVKLQVNCGYLCQPNWAQFEKWGVANFHEVNPMAREKWSYLNQGKYIAGGKNNSAHQSSYTAGKGPIDQYHGQVGDQSQHGDQYHVRDEYISGLGFVEGSIIPS